MEPMPLPAVRCRAARDPRFPALAVAQQRDTLRHGKMRASAAAGAGYTNWNPLASMTILKNTRAFRLSVHRTTPLLVAAFIAFAGLHVSEAQDSTGSSLTSDVAALRKEIAKLQQDMETLRAENAALQRENDSLRRMLATRNADKPANASRTNSVRQSGSPRPASSATGSRTNAVLDNLQRPGAPNASTAYWLSTWSGLRHNSGCRYYRNSTGKPCGPNDGKACKTCGG